MDGNVSFVTRSDMKLIRVVDQRVDQQIGLDRDAVMSDLINSPFSDHYLY